MFPGLVHNILVLLSSTDYTWHLSPWKTKVMLYGTMRREMGQAALPPEGEMSLKHHLTQKGGDKTGGCEYTNHDPA